MAEIVEPDQTGRGPEPDAPAAAPASTLFGGPSALPPSFRDLAIAVYREAETNGDPEWVQAMPEERAAAVAGRILTVAGEVQALEARGYMGPGAMAAYLADMLAMTPEPIPDRRATAGATAKPDLILNIDDYRESIPASIPWIAKPLAYTGGVSLISGPPKAGKSSLAAHLQRCRETGDRLFGAWDVTTGPTLLVTEEGGVAVVYKTEGLHALDVLDRRSAVQAGLRFAAVLGIVGEWGATHPAGLVFIDTLAIWAGIVDENDASETTRAIAAVTAVAQAAGLAIVLVHHARKGGGADGEAVRGSGAILAAVDIAIELSRVGPGSDGRYLDIMGRVSLPQRYELDFDRSTMTYTLADQADQASSRLAEIEADLVGIPADGEGLTRNDLHVLWRKDPRARAEQLVNIGRLRVDYLKTGRYWGNRYWSIPPAWTPGGSS